MKTQPALRPDLIAIIVLSAVTIALFWPAKDFERYYYDDGAYLDTNGHVANGITWEGLKWAFSTGHTGYPHPLTWVSLMFDTQIFGTEAQGYRLTNLLIHTTNICLVFMLCRRLLGAQSFLIPLFVATTFAWHPTRLESVVWIAERKDVLWTFFLLLSVGGYLAYRERSTVGRYLGLVLLPFVLAILSKPSAVIIPPLLMLLDVWPLSRIAVDSSKSFIGRMLDLAKGGIRFLPEKIPLVVIAAVWGWLSWSVAESSEINSSLESLPLLSRIMTIPVTYGMYIFRFFIPENLTILRLHPLHAPPWGMIGLGAIVLLGCSFVALATVSRRPYFFVSWFWFVGMLFPVCGLFQNGMQLVAYRYTYASYIGLSMFFCLALRDYWPSVARTKRIEAAIWSAIWGLFLVTGLRWELPLWKNDFSLWERAILVNPKNYVALSNLSAAAHLSGHLEEAEVVARRAISISPDSEYAIRNLAIVLSKLGKYMEAEQIFAKIPDLAKAAPSLAAERARNSLAAGRLTDAEAQYKAITDHHPDAAEASLERAMVLREMGRLPESIALLRALLEQGPNFATTQMQLAIALTLTNEKTEANRSLAVRLARAAAKACGESNTSAQAGLAYVLRVSGNAEEGARVAMKLSPQSLPRRSRPGFEAWLNDFRRGVVTPPPTLLISSISR